MSSEDAREPAPLRADARRMLSVWREADGMPRDARARVWKRLHRPARPAARRQDFTWMLAAVAIAAAVLLVWWGVASLRRAAIADNASAIDQAADRSASPPTAPVVVAEVPNAPPVVVAPTPEPSAAIAPVQAPARIETARPRATTSRDQAPPVETTTLARERDLIARAWSALADGDHGAALQRAAEHEQAFPDGLLAPERRAIAVIARCKRGDRGAREAGQAWLTAQPRSPLANRVRVACE